MKLSELHNCEKCQGKIVMISRDALGVSRCGYCNEIVPYNLWNPEEEEEKKSKEVKDNG